MPLLDTISNTNIERKKVSFQKNSAFIAPFKIQKLYIINLVATWELNMKAVSYF